MHNDIKKDSLSSVKIWGLFFLYTFFVSAFVQFIFLPYVFPFLHAGKGLLNSPLDSSAFHDLAVDLSNKIRINGWSAWQLRPYGQSPAGIASIFYFFIIPDPRILIPLIAVLHASAAVVLVNLMNLLTKDKVKAIICVLPFLVFPSNLLWTAQWHRDSFSILGVALILQGMISFSRIEDHKSKGWFFIDLYSFIYCVCGFILIWIARPYILAVIRPFMALLFMLLFLLYLMKAFKKEISWQKAIVTLLFMLLTFFTLLQVKTYLYDGEFKEKIFNLDTEIESAGPETEEVFEPPITVQPASEEPLVKEETEAVVIAEQKADPASVVQPLSEKPSVKEDAAVVAIDEQKPDPPVTGQPVSEEPLVEEKTDAVVIAEQKADPASVIQSLSEKPLVKEEAMVAVAVEQKIDYARPDAEKGIDKPEAKKIKVKRKKTFDGYYIEDRWKKTSWLPSFIENKARSLALTRRGFRLTAPEAKSNIDHDVGFSSVTDMLAYLPRAVQIVFLAPFPNEWLRDGSYPANSLMRKVSAFEMIVTYFSLIFLPYAVWHWRKRIEVWIIFIFCVYVMLVYGLVVCNVGTLYRMRYLYITILIALGIAGFSAFLEQRRMKREK
jgi:hypothetical protein